MAKIAYLRVSTNSQNLDRQEELINSFDFEKVFTEKHTGADRKRPNLEKCLEYVRSGDCLYVYSIDRLARNMKDLLSILDVLQKKEVDVFFHKENIRFSQTEKDPMTKLFLHILSAFAEFERNIIKERQQEGILLAKKRGAFKGRKSTKTVEEIAEIEKLYNQGFSVAKIAEKTGFSRTNIYSYIPKDIKIIFTISTNQELKSFAKFKVIAIKKYHKRLESIADAIMNFLYKENFIVKSQDDFQGENIKNLILTISLNKEMKGKAFFDPMPPINDRDTTDYRGNFAMIINNFLIESGIVEKNV